MPYQINFSINFNYFKIHGDRDSLRAGWSGVQTRMEARLSVPVQIGPGTHIASFTMDTGLLYGV